MCCSCAWIGDNYIDPAHTIKGGNAIYEAGFIDRGTHNPRVCCPQGLYLLALLDLWDRFVTKFTQCAYESLCDVSLRDSGAHTEDRLNYVNMQARFKKYR